MESKKHWLGRESGSPWGSGNVLCLDLCNVGAYLKTDWASLNYALYWMYITCHFLKRASWKMCWSATWKPVWMIIIIMYRMLTIYLSGMPFIECLWYVRHCVLYVLFYLIFTVVLEEVNTPSHFMDEKTEVSRTQLTCLDYIVSPGLPCGWKFN